MHTRHAILLVCVLACGHAASHPVPASPPAAAAVVLAGPAIPAESLRVAATDPFGVALAQKLAPGAAVRIVSDRGALDLVDSGADIIVTDRLAVIRYATSRSAFAVIPLPWDRQYAFISANAFPIADVVDAVHADARPAAAQCPMDSGQRGPPLVRILYAPDDSIARSLAERLVGLGVARRGVPYTVARSAMPFNVERLIPEAFIAARPIDSARCEVGSFHAVPLVDTRSQLIVRRGSVRVATDTAGGVRLETTP